VQRKSNPGTLYFGRNLALLSRLAVWGYPVGFELHHPPRSDRKMAALERIIEAPRFLGLVVTTESLRVYLLARFPALSPSRLLVAHDGVRADRILEPRLRSGDLLRTVYCGSFHQGKGVETLVAAAALVPQVQFDVIGGQASQIEAIRSQATPNVRFLGSMSYEDTQRLLPQYDIALAPYGSVVRGVRKPKHESLAPWMSPLKLFEYMGAGLPIVTSDLPVLKEILQDGVTALMPPPDDPPAHAAAIRALAADGDLRLRLARAAQDSPRSYTWENRAARILDFLKAGL
jgi:glycosyltransferase involved in cell wall biosynthesis